MGALTLSKDHSGLDPNASPWTRFKERPPGYFIDAVLKHIKDTGSPETLDGLYRSRLPNTARYMILKKVTIDRKKRPERDMAPCPMCTINRFLRGALVWCYDLELAAVIGHDCAEHAEEAEREFKLAETQRRQEDYLLAAFPKLAAKRATLQTLKGPANDALVLYRAFRRSLAGLHQQLRLVKDRDDRLLLLAEVIGADDGESGSDYHGPAGFRGLRGRQVNSRDHNFGRVAGTTALLREYHPVRDLEDAIRTADALPFDGGEEEALDAIAAMTAKERHAAVAIGQALDRRFVRLIERLRDFRAFWSADNLQRLNAYGTSPFNPAPFEAKLESFKNRPLVTLKQQGQKFRAIVPAALDHLDRDWDLFTFEN